MSAVTRDELVRRASAVGQADLELRSLKYRGMFEGVRDPERVIRALAFWRWQAKERKEGAVR